MYFLTISGILIIRQNGEIFVPYGNDVRFVIWDQTNG